MRTFALVAALCVVAPVFAQVEPGRKPEPELEVKVPEYGNGTCPIMGKPASLSLFVDTPKGRIYICCAPCIKKIKQDVDRAVRVAYPTTQAVGNDRCPITGNKTDGDSPTVILQGLEIAVCCTECVKTARRNAQVTIVKAKNPKARDVANATCPVTGEPADANLIILIGDDIVHLSSSLCVDAAKKAPAATLAEAKKIAARDAEKRSKKDQGS